MFDFPAALLFAKIVQSHLLHLRTFLVLKLLSILSTSFLASGSSVKVVQPVKSFRTVCSMTIFGKKIQPYEVHGSKSSIFVFLQ